MKTAKEKSNEQKSFMYNFKGLRTAHRLTQFDMAQHFDCTPTAISYWESGKAMPSIEKLNEIAKFFDVTIDDLINYRFEIVMEFMAHQKIDKKEWDSQSFKNVGLESEEEQ